MVRDKRFFRCALAIFAVVLSSCAHQGPAREVAASRQVLPPTRIIDAHAHFSDEQTIQPDEKMLGEFRDAGVVGAVVHASRHGKQAPRVRADSPVKFAVCAAIVPGATVKQVERGIESRQYHCMKVYLGYVPKFASDPFYAPFYQLAERKQVPVVFHTGDTYDKMAKVKYADPLTIDEVAVTFPKVKFLLAHLGNPWIQSAAEVVYKNDNVYADTSGLMLDDVSKASVESVEELVVKPLRWFFLYVENPKKILFGSDWSLVKIRPYAEAIRRAIPEAHWEDVFFGNAVRLFKLDIANKQLAE